MYKAKPSILFNHCPSCKTLSGKSSPPGGIVYQNEHWMFFLRGKPLFVAGQGFVILKRHCEDLSELNDAELQTLGPTLQHVTQLLKTTLKPAKVHIGLYAEGVKHIHFHIMPRMPDMPAGNIPLTFLGQWYELLYRLKLRRAVSDSEVTRVAAQLRNASQQLMDASQR